MGILASPLEEQSTKHSRGMYLHNQQIPVRRRPLEIPTSYLHNKWIKSDCGKMRPEHTSSAGQLIRRSEIRSQEQ
eukprot:2877500-Ditylum_brightwellii.AAC.1